VNYSQGEEQKHILEHVGETGRFLDIGAWHAKNLSNTRALYERGWSGVLVEPSPEPFLGLLKEYGEEERISLVCACVGGMETLAQFHASADAVTTSSQENFEKWREIGGFYGRFYSPRVDLDYLMERFGEFDFISIDAEGSSVEIFSDLLHLPRFIDGGGLPRVICVEHDNRNVETLELAEAHGYREVYFSGENQVFARTI
jgi:FkbM family methyltransferase